MSNRLANETSPYLQQHANNPVDWYPWGEEAFSRAALEQKPVFLSIGYSTCHWCHVMAHESFEDAETARILNRHFISVKVDREERPDIDSVYMAVCQAFTGSGGWPMTLFLTPDKQPFFAGTYFPVKSQYGMPGFRDLLRTIADRWKNDREALLESAGEIVSRLQTVERTAGGINAGLLDEGARQFSRLFDAKNGGFGDAPKFPTPHNLLFLLAYAAAKENPHALEMVTVTLTQMRKGGIFDQIGYGFSRYSTDPYFLAPHFEKMLYDNALLTLAYAAAYAVTGVSGFLDTAEKTAAYVLRELTGPEGAFYAAEDADSDGEEGKFYLFGYDELLGILGREEGEAFARYYGITKKGNFEGSNIPNRLHAENEGGAFDAYLPRLVQYRRQRARLHLDDKILTSWNALMIAAFAFLQRITGKSCYLDAARKARGFIEAKLADGDKLFVSYRDGRRGSSGFLDDYAFYAAALLSLYEATGEGEYLQRARSVCREAVRQFADPAGGFTLSGRENEDLVLRPKETYDGALPSGNAIMAYNLVRLSQITREAEWEEAAEKQLAFLSGQAADYPAGHSMFLLALLVHLNPPPSITVALQSPEDWERVKGELPLFADLTVLPAPSKDYPLKDGRTTFYVCRGRTCQPPANHL